jgi:hypothetical protein
MEPAPDATPVAGIEFVVAPDQALGLETASADRVGPAPATMDEWAVATITEGMDSPPLQSERVWTAESAAQAPSPMPVPVAHPAPGTEAVSAPEPGNADAPLAVNSGWCAADPAARRPWYLPATSPVVSICFDLAALPPQGAQPALDAASQPPARWNFASFTVEAPRARVPEEPAMSAPYFVGAKFLPFGA